MNLKIITCNVRGLGEMKKRRQIYKYLHEKKCNVVFMQETHSTKNSEKIWRNEWDGRIFFDHGTGNARGVCILLTKNLDFELLEVHRSHEGQYIIIKLETDGRQILFCNMYAPNVDQPNYFMKVFETVHNSDADIKVMGGDINQILDPDLDKKGGKVTKLTNSAEFINSFLEEYDW